VTFKLYAQQFDLTWPINYCITRLYLNTLQCTRSSNQVANYSLAAAFLLITYQKLDLLYSQGYRSIMQLYLLSGGTGKALLLTGCFLQFDFV